jgi:hypothetical protein
VRSARSSRTTSPHPAGPASRRSTRRRPRRRRPRPGPVAHAAPPHPTAALDEDPRPIRAEEVARVLERRVGPPYAVRSTSRSGAPSRTPRVSARGWSPAPGSSRSTARTEGAGIALLEHLVERAVERLPEQPRQDLRWEHATAPAPAGSPSESRSRTTSKTASPASSPSSCAERRPRPLRAPGGPSPPRGGPAAGAARSPASRFTSISNFGPAKNVPRSVRATRMTRPAALERVE